MENGKEKKIVEEIFILYIAEKVKLCRGEKVKFPYRRKV
jgi:hypothetical protein